MNTYVYQSLVLCHTQGETWFSFQKADYSPTINDKMNTMENMGKDATLRFTKRINARTHSKLSDFTLPLRSL